MAARRQRLLACSESWPCGWRIQSVISENGGGDIG